MNKVSSQASPQPIANFSPAARFLQRKCACGGHTSGGECGQCSKQRHASLQPKLEVSEPGDAYEQEADRIAGQVMRMSAVPQLPSRSASSIQRKANASPARAGTQVVDDVLSSGGQPLDATARSFFEPRFGYDFSRVRVHTNDRAAESAKALNARAYTVGEHVVFAARQFSLGTGAGRQLMAHELTHVIQQGRADDTSQSEHADTSIQPEEDTEDTGLQTAEGLSVSRSPMAVSRQVAPTLTPGLMLQKASCPCCTDSISISNISRIDTAARMGHNFDVNMALSYPASGPSGSCTLEWWEKTNVPYHPGMSPNTWTNMFALVPGSPTFAPWKNRGTDCATSAPVTITDVPSLGRSAGRTVTRTLEFRIVINSMPPTSEAGCANASQQVTATQVLSMVNGAPDWAASSFTTP